MPRGLQWLGVVGPGVIVLGASIGSGEFLLGPAAFVKYGLTMLWVAGAAMVLQTLFNVELMRYTLATGEPVVTGFMRTKPHATFWAWVYAGLYFLQVGWPAWAGTAAGAFFFLFTKRLSGAPDANTVYAIAVGLFLACVLILLVGRRIERTLEMLNWILVACILAGFTVLALWLVPGGTVLTAAAGLFGYSPAAGEFKFIPEGADFFLIGAFAGYSGAGGVINLTLTNWARDRGYGMGGNAGFIPSAMGGKKSELAHSGFHFPDTPEEMSKWRGWWRIVYADQWGVFFTGAILGMILPALLYVTFLAPGTDIRGYGIAAALAEAMVAAGVPLLGGMVALIGAWILFKTQLDILEGIARSITDIVWTGSDSVRKWRGGDVRVVYYTVLSVLVVWGIVALKLAQPVFLLQLGANVAGVVFVISSMHLLYVNTRLLPVHCRPPMWRRLMLVVFAAFYGTFVVMWIRGLLAA
ncbi:MAG: Nramp family divalent metal transporter [Cytophagaceae bacterium]|nr:Nramp family divalent metal transporter [Gemmatimonadaceae bacterium]